MAGACCMLACLLACLLARLFATCCTSYVLLRSLLGTHARCFVPCPVCKDPLSLFIFASWSSGKCVALDKIGTLDALPGGE